MTDLLIGEQLYTQGITPLVSVIPPGAQLTPSSKIAQSQLGKVPGRRLPNGLWAGYDWRRHQATLDDARAWSLAGASLGVLARDFPGVDIDCFDEALADIIQTAAVAALGPAPVRIGRAPKRLLMYRTEVPFGRLRLWITYQAEHHLVEILGDGQQYLVAGTHPGTMLPYTWDCPIEALTPEKLTPITREQAEAFLATLAEGVQALGAVVEREGDGRVTGQATVSQEGLLAPSLELLREAVDWVPNTNALFPARTDYLRMGYAIRAAAGDALDEGQAIFQGWAARWEGNDRAPGNDPETVLADWRRMKGPYQLGWNWVAEQARVFGFQAAALDFEATGEAPNAEKGTPDAPLYSDQWLADYVADVRRHELRYVPQSDRFLVWNGARWQVDSDLLAEDVINQELRKIADRVMRGGATEKEKREAHAMAVQLCSAGKAAAVAKMLKSNRAVAISQELLDKDPWVLNTPNGLIDLTRGAVPAPDPDALCTCSTVVPVDKGGSCPRWLQFLREATNNDQDKIDYLQRLAGYALTGSTREQQLTFLWGKGGNGKGTFVGAVQGILGDYARQADMNTFTYSSSERHTTELAYLHGARLVTASETQAGKRWDEQRVKALTGGDPITARFMRQDNFTFRPQFKLLFLGNHKPELRDVDAAMKRRMQMVPFLFQPPEPDQTLEAKLREEWPAILAWMVEGCLKWQQTGLMPPESVRVATEEYLTDEDAFGRWLKEDTVADPDSVHTTEELFGSWREWANANGEYPGSTKRLASRLTTNGYARWREAKTRRMGFKGLRIISRLDLETC